MEFDIYFGRILAFVNELCVFSRFPLHETLPIWTGPAVITDRPPAIRYAYRRWTMPELLTRNTIDPDQMQVRPCVRGLRITVSDVLNLLSAGQSRDDFMLEYPYLEAEDIDDVLAFEQSHS